MENAVQKLITQGVKPTGLYHWVKMSPDTLPEMKECFMAETKVSSKDDRVLELDRDPSQMFDLCGLDIIDLGTATSNSGMVER